MTQSEFDRLGDLSLFFIVDDCEGAAGVEDSSLHFKLEKRKGIVHAEIST